MTDMMAMDKFVIAFKQLTIVMFVLGLGGYGVLVLLYFCNVQEVRALFDAKPACTFGLPLSGAAALGLVSFLEQAAGGNLEFKAFGLQFTGPGGPVTLWVVCYLTLVGSIKLLA